jgi:molybdopterin molybdotransferase
MLTPAEAVESILPEIRVLPSEQVPLREVMGRVLAASVVSPVTLPHWDNSAMDGYAVRAVDVAGSTRAEPRQLRVTQTIVAGAFSSREIGSGEAARIMTGAPVPPGADTVVRSEDTNASSGTVSVYDDRDSGRNIRPRGEDIHAGDVVLAAGQTIGAAQIGVLASVGCASVEVVRRPTVAIAGSGNELVDLDRFDEVLSGRRIVSSNSYALAALVGACNALPRDLGIARDDPEEVQAMLRQAGECDMILTSAGVSVGEMDYTRGAMQELGAVMKFWRVRMRPGAPIGFGMLRGVPWMGLPGNPVSAMVTFELFVRPALLRMGGHTAIFRKPVAVKMKEAVQLNAGAGLTHFLRAVVSADADGYSARLTGPQGSGILTSMSRANALLIVPEGRPRVDAGGTLNALFLREDTTFTNEFAL